MKEGTYYSQHRAHCLELTKKWQAAHPGYMEEYERKNKRRICIKRSEYYQAHRDRILARVKAAYWAKKQKAEEYGS